MDRILMSTCFSLALSWTLNLSHAQELPLHLGEFVAIKYPVPPIVNDIIFQTVEWRSYVRGPECLFFEAEAGWILTVRTQCKEPYPPTFGSLRAVEIYESAMDHFAGEDRQRLDVFVAGTNQIRSAECVIFVEMPVESDIIFAATDAKNYSVCFTAGIFPNGELSNPRITISKSSCNCDPIGSLSPRCDENGTCECLSGFGGEKCSRITCFGLDHEHPNVCSGNGDCIHVDGCDCEPEREGLVCEACVANRWGDDCEDLIPGSLPLPVMISIGAVAFVIGIILVYFLLRTHKGMNDVFCGISPVKIIILIWLLVIVTTALVIVFVNELPQGVFDAFTVIIPVVVGGVLTFCFGVWRFNNGEKDSDADLVSGNPSQPFIKQNHPPQQIIYNQQTHPQNPQNQQTHPQNPQNQQDTGYPNGQYYYNQSNDMGPASFHQQEILPSAAEIEEKTAENILGTNHTDTQNISGGNYADTHAEQQQQQQQQQNDMRQGKKESEIPTSLRDENFGNQSSDLQGSKEQLGTKVKREEPTDYSYLEERFRQGKQIGKYNYANPTNIHKTF